MNKNRTTSPFLFIRFSFQIVVRLSFAGIQKGARQTGGPTMQPVEFIFIGTKLEYDES
jgi:hypothetical protein